VAANCAEAGVLGVLPGLMGSLQATEVIKLITGIGAPLIGRLLTYDALNMHFSEFRFKRRVDCAVCGDQPSIIELRDAPAAAAAPASGVRSYSAAELRAALGALTLVDVREADEFASGHIVGSLHIPLGELPQRLAELRGHANVTFLCRTGVRSQAASALAVAAGLTQIGHLAGGIAGFQALPAPLQYSL
jgi:adenylyltransferase/sulfurtransferase